VKLVSPSSLSLLALVAASVACGAGSSEDVSTDTSEPLIEAQTHVLDAEPGADVDVQDGKLVFPADTRFATDLASASQGDVLVSGHGKGFARRILDRKTQDGKIVVTTENAALTDIFKRAHYRSPAGDATAVNPEAFHVPLPALSIAGVRLPLGGEGGELEIEEGSWSLDPQVDFTFDVDDNHFQKMQLYVSAPATAKLKVKYHIARPAYVGNGLTFHFGEPGKVIAEAPEHFTLVWIGWVPVVIVTKVQLLAGFQLMVGGEVEGETALVANGHASAGVSYDGAWHNLSSTGLDVKLDGAPTFDSTTLGGDLTLTAKLSVSVYDLAGPYVELQGYAGVGRDSGNAAQLGSADVYGEVGLRGIVGVEAAPFGKLVVGYQSVLFDKSLHFPIVASP
jgi:hypothetical protein